jgi:D-alanyl-D-alanine carboxypeptidase (penicillin-binding protein 5/6)
MKKSSLYNAIIVILSLTLFFGFYFNGTSFQDQYDTDEFVEVYNRSDMPYGDPVGLGANHAVVSADTEINSDLFQDNTYAVLMVDNEDNSCIVAYNALRRIYPASMTKLLTASIVCDEIEQGNLNLEDEYTLPHDIDLGDSQASASGLKEGDTITVRDMLYGFLLESDNDFGVAFAELISGSVDAFADRMNQKAAEIGATNSHFVNPHGLHDDNHYITAYDMYLIINEAASHDIIREIDSYKSYTYSYTDAKGNRVEKTVSATNAYLSDEATLPSNISIEAWKTGTTKKAGRCISMVVEIDGKEYTLVVADSVSREDLYNNVSMMFNLTK